MSGLRETEGGSIEQAMKRENLFLENDSMVLEVWIYNDETAVTTLRRQSRRIFATTFLQ